jgi:hypothetical protein
MAFGAIKWLWALNGIGDTSIYEARYFVLFCFVLFWGYVY